MGRAILLYSNDHKGQYPPDLGTLIIEVEMGMEVFVCPSGSTALPPDHVTMTPQQKAAWVNEHADYVYLGKGMNNTATSDQVVVHERGDAHGDGMNLLFGDGHVSFEFMFEAKRLIQEASMPKPQKK